MIDRRVFLLSTAGLLAGAPTISRAWPRVCNTGLPSPEIDLTYESVELLRQILPRLQRVGLMHTPADPLQVRQSLLLAEKIGVTFMPVGVGRSADVKSAFGTLSAQRAEAVIVPAGLWYAGFHGWIVAQAAVSRLPALYAAPGFAEAGGLLSVSPKRPDNYWRAATEMARLLKDARPAEPAIDQPADFELIVNLKTAKSLDITIPAAMLLRADRVIA